MCIRFYGPRRLRKYSRSHASLKGENVLGSFAGIDKSSAASSFALRSVSVAVGILRTHDDDGIVVAVERPGCPHCGHRETAMLQLDEVVPDPTDQDLAELKPGELARFGMTRERLLR